MRLALLLVLAAVLGACSAAASAGPSLTKTEYPSAALPTAARSAPAVESAAVTPSASPLVSSADSSSASQSLVGTWTRTQSCKEQLAAYTSAGLLDKAQEWVTANWVGEHATATNGRFCEGSVDPREHSHYFSADGLFGSLDEHGTQVDDGHYVFRDASTIQFPDHDFGYAGGPLVAYSINDDVATFSVTVPDPCTGACRQAYAWALSAFFGSEPWMRQPGH